MGSPPDRSSTYVESKATGRQRKDALVELLPGTAARNGFVVEVSAAELFDRSITYRTLLGRAMNYRTPAGRESEPGEREQVEMVSLLNAENPTRNDNKVADRVVIGRAGLINETGVSGLSVHLDASLKNNLDLAQERTTAGGAQYYHFVARFAKSDQGGVEALLQ
ncbi:MAG: hypothetical protein HY438_04415 [DPANN group archaeon]|nr:hypothetical protein [DPANN group archaeon]